MKQKLRNNQKLRLYIVTEYDPDKPETSFTMVVPSIHDLLTLAGKLRRFLESKKGFQCTIAKNGNIIRILCRRGTRARVVEITSLENILKTSRVVR